MKQYVGTWRIPERAQRRVHQKQDTTAVAQQLCTVLMRTAVTATRRKSCNDSKENGMNYAVNKLLNT